MVNTDRCHEATASPAEDASPSTPPLVLVIMGVSGCGKSTVAALLASRLGWPFEEGDALHPIANIQKLAAGQPLTDQDRRPWLRTVAAWIDDRLAVGCTGVITCSALKRSYRDDLNTRGFGVEFIYLAGSEEAITRRLHNRRGHFMPPALLISQFADLEEPTTAEPAARFDAELPPDVIVAHIIEELRLGQAPGLQTWSDIS